MSSARRDSASKTALAGAALWLAFAMGAVAPAHGQEPVPAAVPADAGAASGQLSDERSRSTWAYVVRRTWARVEPGYDAPVIKRLSPEVSFTFSPEVVLLLRRRTLTDGSVWVKVRLPMRPNNTTGWVKRDALGQFRVAKGRMVIDRRRLRATLYGANGRRLWSARIGVGQRRWPTPRGRFYIRERMQIPRGPLRPMYGPFVFGTSAHSATLSGGNWGEGVIGIHGTGAPELLPGRVSHGCVRVSNDSIQKLRRLMSVGTPVLIR